MKFKCVTLLYQSHVVILNRFAVESVLSSLLMPMRRFSSPSNPDDGAP